MSKVNSVKELQNERERRQVARQLRDRASDVALLIERGHSFFTCEEELLQLSKLITEARHAIGEYSNDYPYTPWEV